MSKADIDFENEIWKAANELQEPIKENLERVK